MVDVSSRGEGPAKVLSNFHAHRFVIDGVVCNSMEGFLQSLKFKSPEMQAEIAKLIGVGAKKRGSGKNWWSKQMLWWRGMAIGRHSAEYQKLLDQAYNALADQNPKFCEALLATGNQPITHSLGRSDPSHTVLTEHEFCSRLLAIRTRLQKEEAQKPQPVIPKPPARSKNKKRRRK